MKSYEVTRIELNTKLTIAITRIEREAKQITASLRRQLDAYLAADVAGCDTIQEATILSEQYLQADAAVKDAPAALAALGKHIEALPALVAKLTEQYAAEYRANIEASLRAERSALSAGRASTLALLPS